MTVALARPARVCAAPGCGEPAQLGRHSKYCGSHGYRAAVAKDFLKSALNRRVDAAYAACIAAGGHTASDDRIKRWPSGSLNTSRGVEVVLTICARCAVPFTRSPGR